MLTVMLQRRFTAPPNQAGLKLKAVLGYNGNGRGNMVWNADTGNIVYYLLIPHGECVLILLLGLWI